MMLLAFECSTDRRSVAVARDATVQAESCHTGGRETPLAGLVGEALARAGARPADITLLALGLGPGSYTGIRASIAFVQGWDLARPVRLLGRSSADACARRAWRDGVRGPITVALDAQRGEAYLAGYDLDEAGALRVAALRLAGRAELEELAGNGPRFVGPDLAALGLKGTPAWPDATALAELAAADRDFLVADRLEPIYLRATAFVKAPPPRHPN